MSLSLSLVLLATGCAPDTGIVDSAQVVGDALWSIRTSSQTTHIAWLALGSVQSADPAVAAMQAAQGTGLPTAICFTRAAAPTPANSVRLTFANCTAPYGLVQLTGDLLVTFSAGSAGSLHADLTGDKLSAYGLSATYIATADWLPTPAGTAPIHWQGGWGATVPVPVANSAPPTTTPVVIGEIADTTLTFDPTTSCRTVDGSVKVTWNARVTESTVSKLRFCSTNATGDTCPSGGANHLSVYSGETSTTVFDGTHAYSGIDALGVAYSASWSCTSMVK